jgi:chaperonin GroES
MKFRPLHDRVVVKRLEEEQKTKGGIIIPDTAAEKPQTGKVVSAGPGVRGEDGKLQPLGVKAGDKVLFGKWSGTEVKLDLLGHGDAVLGGARCAERLLEDNVAALGTERYFDSVGEDIHAAHHALAGLGAEFHIFNSHMSLLLLELQSSSRARVLRVAKDGQFWVGEGVSPGCP